MELANVLNNPALEDLAAIIAEQSMSVVAWVGSGLRARV